jgi:hypothetical protein
VVDAGFVDLTPRCEAPDVSELVLANLLAVDLVLRTFDRVTMLRFNEVNFFMRDDGGEIVEKLWTGELIG